MPGINHLTFLFFNISIKPFWIRGDGIHAFLKATVFSTFSLIWWPKWWPNQHFKKVFPHPEYPMTPDKKMALWQMNPHFQM